MSQSTQDVPTLDGRLDGVDRRLGEIQAELVPQPAPHDVPEESAREPSGRGRTGPLASVLSRAPYGSAAGEQLDRIGALTAVYTDLLSSLRELLESDDTSRSTPDADELITVSAGPIETKGGLDAFEQRLAALPGVTDVHLRSYEAADRAVFDVRLGDDSS